jgi:Ran GTPase-activating protein (RanGAP) involved in mRNA processing and transport
VDLSDNFFAGEGAQLLAKALAAQTHLTDLNLRDASLEDDGAKAVVKVRLS